MDSIQRLKYPKSQIISLQNEREIQKEPQNKQEYQKLKNLLKTIGFNEHELKKRIRNRQPMCQHRIDRNILQLKSNLFLLEPSNFTYPKLQLQTFKIKEARNKLHQQKVQSVQEQRQVSKSVLLQFSQEKEEEIQNQRVNVTKLRDSRINQSGAQQKKWFKGLSFSRQNKVTSNKGEGKTSGYNEIQQEKSKGFINTFSEKFRNSPYLSDNPQLYRSQSQFNQNKPLSLSTKKKKNKSQSFYFPMIELIQEDKDQKKHRREQVLQLKQKSGFQDLKQVN